MDSSAPEWNAGGKLKSTRIVKKCSPNTGPTSDAGMTCEPFRRLPPKIGPSMSFVEGSRVRTSVMQESGQALKASDQGSGLNTRGSFARYDRESSSWRTSQRCLDAMGGAEWFCLPASDIGACQIRDRVFVVANNAERGIQELLTSESNGDAPFVAARRLRSLEERAKSWNGSMDVVPRMVRATHGISRRMDDARAMQLGNAVVPQVAEYLGRRIITAVTAGQEQP